MSDQAPTNDRIQSSNHGHHEPDTISVRAMTLAGGGLFALILLATGGVAVALQQLGNFGSHIDADRQWKLQATSPGVVPGQAYDRLKIQAAESARLQQYRWQDKTRGIASVPIDRAIELMTQAKLQVDWPTTVEVEP